MGTFTDTIAIVIKADGAKAASEFKKVGDSAQRELDKAEKSSRDWGASLTKIGVGLTTTAAVGGVALYRLGQDASDLAETMSKSQRIFGESATAVSKFGDSAADKLGQSKEAAVDAASTFGALAKGVGQSKDEAAKFGITLTTLASDMASFANTRPEDAVLALGAALRGESEPIRKYNVLLNDAAVKAEAYRSGIAKQGAILTEGQKVQARYNLILKQTGDIQGDFARTATGAANQQRILSARMDDLRAKIGAGVLPAMTELLSVVSSGVDVFASMDSATGGLVGKLATIGVGASGAIGAVSLLAGQLGKLKQAALVDPSAGLSGGLTTFGKVAGFAGGAAVILGGVWAAMAERAEAAQARVDALTDAVKSSGRTLGQVAAQQAAEFIGASDDIRAAMKAAGISTQDYANAVIRGGSAFDDVRDKARQYGDELGRQGQANTDAQRAAYTLFQQVKEQRTAFEGAREEIRATNEAQKALNGVQLDGTRAAKEIGAANNSAAAGQGRAARAATQHAESLSALIDIAGKYTDRMFGARDTARDFASAQLDATEANLRVGEAQKEYTAAVAEFGKASPEAAQAARDFQRAVIDASASQDGAAQAAIAHAASLAKYVEGSKTAEARSGAFVAELIRLRDTTAGPVQAALSQHIATILGIPVKKATTITTTAAEETVRVRGLKNEIDGLHDRTVYLNVVTRQTGKTTGELFGGGRASGGPVSKDTIYAVGEQGPEWFIPKQDGEIIPADRVRAASRNLNTVGVGGGGGGDIYHLHFHGPVASQRQAEDWVLSAIASARRSGKRVAA